MFKRLLIWWHKVTDSKEFYTVYRDGRTLIMSYEQCSTYARLYSGTVHHSSELPAEEVFLARYSGKYWGKYWGKR